MYRVLWQCSISCHCCEQCYGLPQSANFTQVETFKPLDRSTSSLANTTNKRRLRSLQWLVCDCYGQGQTLSRPRCLNMSTVYFHLCNDMHLFFLYFGVWCIIKNIFGNTYFPPLFQKYCYNLIKLVYFDHFYKSIFVHIWITKKYYIDKNLCLCLKTTVLNQKYFYVSRTYICLLYTSRCV